jgi:hypothetical protein
VVVVVGLLTSPFILILGCFYLLAVLSGPFLARLVVCVGLLVAGLAWRRRNTAAAPAGAAQAAGWGWPAASPGKPARPHTPEQQGWTVTRPPQPSRPGRPAPASTTPALPAGAVEELQLVAVLGDRSGRQAELHLAPGMAHLPLVVLARQVAAVLAAEQGDTGWRLELLEVADPAAAGQPDAATSWGWGG